MPTPFELREGASRLHYGSLCYLYAKLYYTVLYTMLNYPMLLYYTMLYENMYQALWTTKQQSRSEDSRRHFGRGSPELKGLLVPQAHGTRRSCPPPHPQLSRIFVVTPFGTCRATAIVILLVTPNIKLPSNLHNNPYSNAYENPKLSKTLMVDLKSSRSHGTVAKR